MTLPASEHRAPLEALGLQGPALERLAAYLDTLAAWSPRVNLTGARTPAQRVLWLVADVVAAAHVPAAGRLVDVGSGNGSPGLVLALLRDDLEVTLLEPRARRWAFLREAARASGRGGIRVERLRHDRYPGPRAATVTLRALALPLAELAGLVEPERPGAGCVALLRVVDRRGRLRPHDRELWHVGRPRVSRERAWAQHCRERAP